MVLQRSISRWLLLAANRPQPIADRAGHLANGPTNGFRKVVVAHKKAIAENSGVGSGSLPSLRC